MSWRPAGVVKVAQPHRWKVWFHRARAVIWLVIGAVSFPFGWANSVVLVWIASFYANVVSDWGNAEAADDREVLQELHEIKAMLRQLMGERGEE